MLKYLMKISSVHSYASRDVRKAKFELPLMYKLETNLNRHGCSSQSGGR